MIAADPWMQTVSGRAWPLLDPRADYVHWPDIAEALAKLARFVGATPGVVYSVAQHCCHVADILPAEIRLYGLLHDAPEFVTADIPSPVKAALGRLGAGPALSWLDTIQAEAIHAAAGLPYPPPPEVEAAVKRADVILLLTERRDLMADCALPWADETAIPLRRSTIKPWPWARADHEWLDRLNRWLPGSAAQIQQRRAGHAD